MLLLLLSYRSLLMSLIGVDCMLGKLLMGKQLSACRCILKKPKTAIPKLANLRGFVDRDEEMEKAERNMTDSTRIHTLGPTYLVCNRS